jgi:23S rRNA (guanosine2251-2'-O)-methyltransferase
MKHDHPQERNPNVIAGRQPVLEALKSTTPIEKILLLFGTKGAALERIKTLAKERGVPIVEASKQRFHELADEAMTQGVLAIVAHQPYVEVEDLLHIAQRKNESPFLLVLDELEDPHNIGALMRSAEGAGIHGVILPKHHSALLGTGVAKSSAGASQHLPTARVTNIVQTLQTLKQQGVWIVGTDAEGEKTYYEIDYHGGIAVVIGNEGRGMRRLVKETCDFLVRIPLYGNIASLNASVAGALVLFEAAKVRNAGKTKE